MNETPPFRPPVTFTIGSGTPMFLGRHDQAFTVINLGTETDTTVWLANNAGMGIGQGTPLYPGTSLYWQAGGDLYAVAESDGVQVILSFDVTDWEPNPIAIATAILNSGILLVDQPAMVFDDEVAASSSTGPIDTSRYQNAHVHLEAVDTITYPTTATVDIRMSIDGMHTLRRLSIGFGEVASFWHANIPIVGNHLEVSVNTPSGSAFHVIVVLSHRPLKMIQDVVFEPGAFVPAINHLFFAIPTVLAPATALTVDSIPPYFGQVNLTVIQSGGAVPVNIDTRINVQEAINGANRNRWMENTWNTVGTNTSQINANLQMAGGAIRLVISNNEATARTFTAWLTPIITLGGDF